MEKQKYDRWNLNNIKAMVRVAYEAGVLQAQKLPGKCSYYEKGYRCAVGQILTGKEIDQLKETNELCIALEMLEDFFKMRGCSDEAFDLLYDLQIKHDAWSREVMDENSSNRFEKEFLELLEFEKVEVE